MPPSSPACRRRPDTTLNFTNQSRSYDATRHAVRFWGYDGAREVSFFVTEHALRGLEPGAPADETGLLVVFEAHYYHVLRVAVGVYARGRERSDEIGATTSDVRRDVAENARAEKSMKIRTNTAGNKDVHTHRVALSSVRAMKWNLGVSNVSSSAFQLPMLAKKASEGGAEVSELRVVFVGGAPFAS